MLLIRKLISSWRVRITVLVVALIGLTLYGYLPFEIPAQTMKTYCNSAERIPLRQMRACYRTISQDVKSAAATLDKMCRNEDERDASLEAIEAQKPPTCLTFETGDEAAPGIDGAPFERLTGLVELLPTSIRPAGLFAVPVEMSLIAGTATRFDWPASGKAALQKGSVMLTIGGPLSAIFTPNKSGGKGRRLVARRENGNAKPIPFIISPEFGATLELTCGSANCTVRFGP